MKKYGSPSAIRRSIVAAASARTSASGRSPGACFTASSMTWVR